MKQTFEYLMDALAILAMALAWVGLCLIPITLALLLASMALGYAHEADTVPYSQRHEQHAQMGGMGYTPGEGYTSSSGSHPPEWKYPWACCSGNDCAKIEGSAVKQTPDGYEVTLNPGDHPMITEATGTKVYVIPYNDERVKVSPDGDYHICIRSATTVNADPAKGPLTVICFYRGPEGF